MGSTKLFNHCPKRVIEPTATVTKGALSKEKAPETDAPEALLSRFSN
jgi:hypothetical protein